MRFDPNVYQSQIYFHLFLFVAYIKNLNKEFLDKFFEDRNIPKFSNNSLSGIFLLCKFFKIFISADCSETLLKDSFPFIFDLVMIN